jgi:hypothetical protein
VRRNEQASRQALNQLLSYRRSTPAGFRRAECSRSLRSSDTLHTLPSSSPTTEAPHPAVSCKVAKLQHLPALRPRTPASCSSRQKARLPPHHASAPRAASRAKPQVLSSSSPTLHPVIAFLLTSSLHSFLAAWTPPAGSLDPRLLQRPRASHSFVFSKTKRGLLWEIENPLTETTKQPHAIQKHPTSINPGRRS